MNQARHSNAFSAFIGSGKAFTALSSPEGSVKRSNLLLGPGGPFKALREFIRTKKARKSVQTLLQSSVGQDKCSKALTGSWRHDEKFKRLISLRGVLKVFKGLIRLRRTRTSLQMLYHGPECPDKRSNALWVSSGPGLSFKRFITTLRAQISGQSLYQAHRARFSVITLFQAPEARISVKSLYQASEGPTNCLNVLSGPWGPG